MHPFFISLWRSIYVFFFFCLCLLESLRLCLWMKIAKFRPLTQRLSCHGSALVVPTLCFCFFVFVSPSLPPPPPPPLSPIFFKYFIRTFWQVDNKLLGWCLLHSDVGISKFVVCVFFFFVCFPTFFFFWCVSFFFFFERRCLAWLVWKCEYYQFHLELEELEGKKRGGLIDCSV